MFVPPAFQKPNCLLYSSRAVFNLFLVLSFACCHKKKEPLPWSPGPRHLSSQEAQSLDGPEPVAVPRNWSVAGKQGMVASANPIATRAGLEMLKKGGNAIDALLAVQWMLNVVEPQASGLGGGAFLLYYEKSSGKVYALDGREEAPAASDPKMFLQKNGTPIPFYPDRITGGLSVGVPGTLALMHYAKKRFGTKQVSFADTFRPAIRLARQGFRVSPRLANAVRTNWKRIRAIPETISIFSKHGRPIAVGEALYQPDLARSFQLIARRGPKVFYQGEIARDIINTIKNNPVRAGRMELSDLAGYRAVERKPVAGNFRGHKIYTMGPPSSAVALLESLAILDGFSDAQLNPDTTMGMHLKLEADKLAFADRALYLADADFIDLNAKALLEPNYIRSRRRLISKKRALPAPALPGHPPGIGRPFQKVAFAWPYRGERPDLPEGTSTSHIVVADAKGNIASATTTIEMGFGSGLVVKNRGFLLNNELTDFDPRPGAANSVEGGQRLRRTALNAEARKTKGGKRPRSSMSPVIAFQNGTPVFALGSPGGSRIIGVAGNVILRLLIQKKDIQEAINAPRFLHRHSQAAELESYYFQRREKMEALKKLGHKIKPLSRWNQVYGGVQGIEILPNGVLRGGADLRREGAAMALEVLP